MIQVVKEQVTDYGSFVSEIAQSVKERMGEGYNVKIYKVIKNNSLELDSLIMLKEGENFTPNIYLMPYYESYLEGTSVEEITGRLCEIYEHYTIPDIKDNFSYSFEEMKPYIIYRLVSYERNEKLLRITPHIKYLDLAITFHCLVRSDDDGIGTIRITNDHMMMWKTSIGELSALAKKNTSKLFPSSIRSMDDVIKGILQEDVVNNLEYEFTEEDFEEFVHHTVTTEKHKMYILSNHKGINGASCMLYEDALSKFANLIQSDFYILPSSIHEIILIPYHKEIKKEALVEMVKDVNRTQVAQDEILSDKVYYYSKEHHAIMM